MRFNQEIDSEPLERFEYYFTHVFRLSVVLSYFGGRERRRKAGILNSGRARGLVREVSRATFSLRSPHGLATG